MYKFIKINREQACPTNADISDFVAVVRLCEKHAHQLFDDYSFQGATMVERVAKLVAEAGKYFWTIRRKRDDKFAGFIYLYDVIGGENEPHSATVGACFERKFWGSGVENCGHKFLKYFFKTLKFRKIKGETFRSNPYITGLMRKLNFRLEGEFKGETVVRGSEETLFSWGLCADEWLNCKKKGAEPLDYTSRSINNRKIIPIFGEKGKDY